jgi:hypothetical protein
MHLACVKIYATYFPPFTNGYINPFLLIKQRQYQKIKVVIFLLFAILICIFASESHALRPTT